MSINSLYLQRMIGLTEQHGSLAERQLLGRWRLELAHFLKVDERHLLAGLLGLEIGIEDRLALTINIKSRQLVPAASLLALMEEAPALTPWARYALQHQLRVHCGLRVAPERVRRTVFIYPRDHEGLASILDDPLLVKAAQELKPLVIGVDDGGGLSMYFPGRDTSWTKTLLHELALPDWMGAAIAPWQEVHFDGPSPHPGKTALELLPLPAAVLTRIVSHYPFQHFRQLFPLRELAGGNFGKDAGTGHLVLYATVN